MLNLKNKIIKKYLQHYMKLSFIKFIKVLQSSDRKL